MPSSEQRAIMHENHIPTALRHHVFDAVHFAQSTHKKAACKKAAGEVLQQAQDERMDGAVPV